MLSFGIRFGEGFDKTNILKIMQSVPSEWDYDFLVIGTSPGGVACAREASRAGKKTAIIKWRKYSAAEDEGYDENVEFISKILSSKTASETSRENSSSLQLMKKNKSSIYNMGSASKSAISHSKISEGRKSPKKTSWTRKVRESRLDLSNELYKRGREGRKLMLKAATVQNSLKQAVNFGWRIHAPFETLTMNWKKLSEQVMDYIMKENWILVNELANEGVEILEGKPSFVDHHIVAIEAKDAKEYEVTADIICAAPAAEYILPEEVPGAIDYGITCDDFIRMSEPPGKTLVVGGTPEGLECAGIVACLRLPVFLVSRSEVLEGYDYQMSQMIIRNLEFHGVVFLKNMILKSVRLSWKDKLLAQMVSTEVNEKGEPLIIKEEEFETVVFAVGRRTSLDYLKLDAVGIESDSMQTKIRTDSRNLTSVQNIYAIGDCAAIQPQSPDISESVGKLLGKRLFWDSTDIMDYSMVPNVIMTPIEYAFAGLSENGALHRFGKECIDVLETYFTPIELIASPQEYQCLIKVIVFKPRNSVIGLHMIGPEASEIIQGFAETIKLGLTADKLASIIGVSATKGYEFTKIKSRSSAEDKNNE